MASPQPVAGLILAAGKGTRMKSDLPKVLHPVRQRTMLEWVMKAFAEADVTKLCIILGQDLSPFEPLLNNHPSLTVCIQEAQRGTADAVASAADAFSKAKKAPYNQSRLFKGRTIDSDYLLIGYGDMPALDGKLLSTFVSNCLENNADVGLIGMRHPEPKGYGRLVLDSNHSLLKIVEEKDADEQTKRINICNSGIVFAKTKVLFELLAEVTPNNAQGEYYLTDCFALAHKRGLCCHVHITDDYQSFNGVNDPTQLAAIEQWMTNAGR